MAILIPIIVGIGGFAVGYVTSKYTTPTHTSEQDPLVELLISEKDKQNNKTIPKSMADELKTFDKKSLNAVVDTIPYRTPTIVDIINVRIRTRRNSLKLSI